MSTKSKNSKGLGTYSDPKFWVENGNLYVQDHLGPRIYMSKQERIDCGLDPNESYDPYDRVRSEARYIGERWLRLAIRDLVEDNVTFKVEVKEIRPGFWAVVYKGKEYTPYSKKELADKVLSTFLSL